MISSTTLSSNYLSIANDLYTLLLFRSADSLYFDFINFKITVIYNHLILYRPLIVSNSNKVMFFFKFFDIKNE